MTDLVVVPSTLALLPAYAGQEDPLPDLRRACHEAVARLVKGHPGEVLVVAVASTSEGMPPPEPAGVRVARHLLLEAGYTGRVRVAVQTPGMGEGAPVDRESADPGDVPSDVDRPEAVLVVANGTATRSEKAPGHLDDRSFAFDEAVGSALDMGDAAVLRALDEALGRELWCRDVPAFRAMGRLARGRVTARMTWAGDPYGVQYWVARWTCDS
jgi:hypothetical protein